MNYIQSTDCYTTHNTEHNALYELEQDTRKEIDEYLSEIDFTEYLEIVNDYTGYDIHEMDDLDDMYNSYAPSWILEELYKIDTNDEFFDAYEKESANEIWDLTCTDKWNMIYDIIHEEFDAYDDEIRDIICEYKDRKKEIETYYEYKNIKEYFDELLYKYGKDEMFIVLSRAF